MEDAADVAASTSTAAGRLPTLHWFTAVGPEHNSLKSSFQRTRCLS